MLIKSLPIGFLGLILFSASAWAATSALQGIVKDPKGHPIKGADIRIEAGGGWKLFKTVKTDANGHYVSDGLPVGTYRVTLVVNGAVKASITNTKTKADQPTQLNFDLKAASASKASAGAKSRKHMVWVPSSTGSHIGGRWVEVDETGSADAVEANNVQTINDSTLEKLRATTGAHPGPKPGGQ